MVITPKETHASFEPDQALRSNNIAGQELAGHLNWDDMHKLWVSESRYRHLFEASTDGILVLDPLVYTISDANPVAAEWLGYTREQLLGREIWHTGLFRDKEMALEILQELQEKHVLRDETLPLHTRDGQRRYVDFVGSLYRTNGHDVIQCNLRDITDRKLAEDALRASEERFRTLASQAPLMIWQTDPTGANIYVNTTWCRFTGLSQEESLGAGWISAIHPDDRDGALERWEQARATRTPYYCQNRLRRSDGVYRYVLVYGSAHSTSEGDFTGYIGTILDITEQKELEIQREAFVGMVTHELKTPLTALQGNIQLAQRRLHRLLAQEEQISAEQQRVLEEALTMLGRSQQQLRVQHRLINDLLDISRIQEDKLELRIAPCDLVELVYETVQDYQAAHPSRLITLELPEQEPLRVAADRDRIQQVLSNYLTNALKFSPSAEPVHVGLSLEADNLRVWVQDHGPGLSLEQQQQIWKRFYQVPEISIQDGPRVGLGLGLYICQQLVGRQQGQVGVESTPGCGATFWFTLPPLASPSLLPEEK